MNEFYRDEFLQVYEAHCAELLASLPDNYLNLCLTDPPYGINYQSNWRVATPKLKKIEGDISPPKSILGEIYRVLKDRTACYVFTRWDVMQSWQAEMEKVGFRVINCIVWDKVQRGFMGDFDGNWDNQHEFILYAVKGNHSLNRPRPSNVIRAAKVRPGDIVHPNQKPVSVWYPMIKASSQEGDLILDPFAGSCSSLLACRQLKRRAIGCDIDRSYLEKVSPRLNQRLLI